MLVRRAMLDCPYGNGGCAVAVIAAWQVVRVLGIAPRMPFYSSTLGRGLQQ